MISRLTIMYIVLLFACCADSKVTKQTAQSFSTLNGNWEMREKDGIVTESWKLVNDSLLEGTSDFIKGDSVIPFEIIRIFRRDDSFFYEAKATGQNNEQPVIFKITSFSDSGFVAENNQHDFPKRITYKIIGKDSIHAWVDDGTEKPLKKSDFYYSRIK